jgi:hypothetical protein
LVELTDNILLVAAEAIRPRMDSVGSDSLNTGKLVCVSEDVNDISMLQVVETDCLSVNNPSTSSEKNSNLPVFHVTSTYNDQSVPAVNENLPHEEKSVSMKQQLKKCRRNGSWLNNFELRTDFFICSL